MLVGVVQFAKGQVEWPFPAEVIEDFPELTDRHVRAVLEFAALRERRPAPARSCCSIKNAVRLTTACAARAEPSAGVVAREDLDVVEVDR